MDDWVEIKFLIFCLLEEEEEQLAYGCYDELRETWDSGGWRGQIAFSVGKSVDGNWRDCGTRVRDVIALKEGGSGLFCLSIWKHFSLMLQTR